MPLVPLALGTAPVSTNWMSAEALGTHGQASSEVNHLYACLKGGW